MKTKIFILISLTTCLMVFSQKDCTEPCIMQKKINQDNYIYNGCINENQENHGKGLLVFTEGNEKTTYNGCWQNGKMHGTGTLTQSNGYKYEGNWKNGKMHGTGILTYSNGNRYEGDFYKNERHGEGTLYSKNEYNQELWWKGVWEEDYQTEGYYSHQNYYNPDDVKIKDSEIGTITAFEDKFGRKYIHVLFNNLKQNFQYDTGADNIILNQMVLRELRNDGVKVTKLGYTTEMTGLVGESIAEAYSINKLTVGNIEVNNVIVFVIPNEVTDCLMGEDFWNKFSRTLRCTDSESGTEITIYK